jgi:hypothetical protein
MWPKHPWDDYKIGFRVIQSGPRIVLDLAHSGQKSMLCTRAEEPVASWALVGTSHWMLKGTEEISMSRSATRSLYDPVSSVIAEVLLQVCNVFELFCSHFCTLSG